VALGALALVAHGTVHAHTAATLYAAPALDRETLDELRGGFVFDNGLVVNFGLTFHTTIDGQPVSVSLTEADLMQGRGIVQRVSDDPVAAGNHFTADVGSHRVTVDITDQVAGLMTVVQNNTHGISIQNDARLDIQIANLRWVAQQYHFDNRAILAVDLVR
jgi:hypothetical protein